MGLRKRKSESVDHAKMRLSGLASISTTLDLGNGMSVSSYSAKIAQAENLLNKLNQTKSDLKAAGDLYEDESNALNKMSERILEAVAVAYGHDSIEYGQAGGTRRSDYRRKVKTDEQPS